MQKAKKPNLSNKTCQVQKLLKAKFTSRLFISYSFVQRLVTTFTLLQMIVELVGMSPQIWLYLNKFHRYHEVPPVVISHDHCHK